MFKLLLLHIKLDLNIQYNIILQLDGFAKKILRLNDNLNTLKFVLTVL